MKHLQDIVLESLLDDEDEIFNKGKYSGLISRIFSKSIDERRLAFGDLESLIESHNPKQHTTTAKMKSSDNYFIQFSRMFKIENGESTGELMHYISYITICKQTEPQSYRITLIDASDEKLGRGISDYVERWQYVRSDFNPRSNGCALYEVPEELNDLFKIIQVEAHNHK